MSANPTETAVAGRALAKYCRNGHRYTKANTIWWAGGRRRCRTCEAANAQRKAERKKTAAKAAAGVLELPNIAAPAVVTTAAATSPVPLSTWSAATELHIIKSRAMNAREEIRWTLAAIERLLNVLGREGTV